MALNDDAYAVLFRGGRRIGPVIPDVVIEEVHRDQVVITDHPVERGAAITDHAFKRPSELEMRCGFSNSTAGTEGYAEAIYATLLSLQAQREPFSVVTGKRAYSNMLVSSLSTTTSKETASVLLISVGLREIIIVDTQTTAAPAGAQKFPQQTSGEASTGAKQAIPLPSPPSLATSRDR